MTNTNTPDQAASEREKYDPVKSFREEIERFKKTNQFNPLTVTSLYVQGAAALSTLEMEIRELKRRIQNQASTIADLRGENP